MRWAPKTGSKASQMRENRLSFLKLTFREVLEQRIWTAGMPSMAFRGSFVIEMIARDPNLALMFFQRISRRLRDAVRILLHVVFRVAPTSSVVGFMRNMGWIGFSFGVSRVIAGIVTVAAGRMMGPSEFGAVNLAVGAGSLLSIPMLFGLNASVVRYGAASGCPGAAIGTAFVLSGTFTVLFSLFGIGFERTLSSMLDISPVIFRWGIVYAAVFTIYSIVTSGQQAAGRFLERGWAELIFALLMALGFGIGFVMLGRTHTSLLIGYCLAYLLSSVVWLAFALPYFRQGLRDPVLTREMLSYGFYGFACGIGFFFTSNFQRFVLNSVLSTSDAGVYQAYTIGTVGMAYYAGTMISTVLFPKASASTNRQRLWDILVRSWLWLIIPVTAVFVLGQALLLVIMGPRYPFSLPLLLLFALCSTVIVILSCMAQLISAQGIKGARLGLVNSMLTGGLTVVLSYLCIPKFGLNGAALALLISHVFTMVFVYLVRGWYY